jgi:hypothetical protein
MQNPRKDRHEPSAKEKCQKIDAAIAAIEDGNISIIADRHNQLAMDFLAASDMEEVLDWVAVFLQEIKAIGPVSCFAGRFAERCSHSGFNDLFLFPYHWNSPSLGERVYLKFGIKTVQTPDDKTHTYYHLDCHEDQP